MKHTDWRSRAACLTADPELFFPLSTAGPSVAQLNRARKVCAGRPGAARVSFALAARKVHGVPGGAGDGERRRLLARAAVGSPVAFRPSPADHIDRGPAA